VENIKKKECPDLQRVSNVVEATIDTDIKTNPEKNT
jgi:hypothetical protein